METQEPQQNKRMNNTQILIMYFVIIQLSIIIGGLIVFMVFGKFKDPSVILDQVSFTSGLISIILAIVAIVYAFLQSREASSQNRLVHEGLIHVNERIAQFISIKEDFNAMTKVLEKQSSEVNASVEKFNNIVSDMQDLSLQIQDKGEISEDIEKNLKVISSELKEIKINQTSSNLKLPIKSSDIWDSKNFVYFSNPPYGSNDKNPNFNFTPNSTIGVNEFRDINSKNPN